MSSTYEDAVPPASSNSSGRSPAEVAVTKTTSGLTATDRTELIHRLLRDALEEPSPVAANLQMNGGDLLEMALLLKRAILEAAQSTHDIDEFRQLHPFIDTYVKVCRQADRVLRLKHEIADCLDRPSSAHSARKPR